MENEIIRLEDMPKISIFECFIINLKAFCKNLIPFLKMLNPIYHLTLATFIMYVPAFVWDVFPSISPKSMLLISLPFLIAGIAYLFYSFWQYLIGMVAVSYLAKDILENKEIKPADKYYSYVKENGKSYAKYWLWTCLIWIVIFAFAAFIVFFTIKSGFYTQMSKPAIIFSVILSSILLWPLSLGLGISHLFWAYGVKQDETGCDKSLAHIIKSVQMCYKDPLRCVGYFLLLGLIVLVITLLISVILGLFMYLTIALLTANHIFNDTKAAEAIVIPIVNIMQNFIYCITAYFTTFMATKFYFNFIKSNN